MGHPKDSTIEDQIFAVRSALVLFASCLEDRFEPGVLRSRLSFWMDEAELRGAEERFIETKKLLYTMAENLKANFPK